MDLEKELEKDLEKDLEAELEADLEADLAGEMESEPISQDSGDVPRTEEGFNLLSPVGLVGAAASRIFGLDNVKTAVEAGAESVGGVLGGVAQGTAMPYVAGLMGAANQALEDALDPNVDVSVEAGYNAFAKEKRGMEQVLANVTEQAPVSGFIGNIMAYTGLAKALGVPLSAAVTRNGKQVMDANMARQLAAFNAAHGYFTANEEQNEYVSAILSAGGGLLADKLTLSVFNKWNAKKMQVKGELQGMADETTLDILTPSQSNKVVKNIKSYVTKHYPSASEAAEDTYRFLGIDKARGIDDLALSAKEAKEMTGRKLDEIVSVMDDLTDPKDFVDGQKIALEVIRDVGSVSEVAMKEKKHLAPALQRVWDDINDIIQEPFIESITPAKTIMKQMKVERVDPQTGGKLIDYIELPETTDAIKVFKKMGPRDLQMTKTRIAQSIQRSLEKKMQGEKLTPSDIKDMEEVKSRIVGALIEKLDDVSDMVGKKSGFAGLDEYQKARRQYGLANRLEEVSHGIQSSKFHKSAFGLGNQAITFKGFYLASLGGIASGAPGVAAGVFMNFMLKSPQTPPKLVRGLRKLSANITANPAGPVAKKLQVLLNSDVDDARIMEEKLTALIGEVNLIDSAVARDIDDVISKKNSIEALIREAGGEEAASRFLDAMESGDPDRIGMTMETVESVIPNASKYIKPGVGWGGKVYSEEKKAMLDTEVERMDISRLQKSKLKKDLWQEGLVPNVQSEPDRFFKMQTRDKRRPQY